jgi:hypothetical protein
MNKYLLLRDNKQSGPYTVSELLEIGIKAYDLVWLDGKSVAWRYPSEIEELKAYSPVVEEQPFDRFYKRPEPVAHPSLRQDEKKQEEKMTHAAYAPKVGLEISEEDLPPQKKVYINFPAAPPPVKKAAPEYRPTVAEVKTAIPARTPEPVTYISKPSSNKNYVYYAAAACIVLLGFIVVLFMNNRSQKEQLKELNTIVKQIENKKANEAAITSTQVKNVTAEPAPAPPQTSETIVNPELLTDNDYSKPKTEEKKSTTPVAEEITAATKKSDKPVEIAPGVTYKERPVLRRSDDQKQASATASSDKAESAPVSSENIFKLVTVKPNSYKTGVLGGISNLQFELTNNSKRELYKVAIEIKYLGPEKKVVNKQTVYFENVSPGQHTTIDVPKSKRGVSIDYAITDIKS